jgi:hypothetical protein
MKLAHGHPGMRTDALVCSTTKESANAQHFGSGHDGGHGPKE